MPKQSGVGYFQGDPCPNGHSGLRDRRGRCVECQRLYHKRYYDTNPKAKVRNVTASRARWQQSTTEERLSWRLVRYGLTLDDYKVMLAAQEGGCAICGGPPNGKGVNYHIDHDHTTGRVRGLLCHSCNTGIGNLRDDPERLERAAHYIRFHRNKGLED